MKFLISALVILAVASPLLTFARLWQIKEWRADRMRAHLRYEGWWGQLFGWIRPLVIGMGLVFLIGSQVAIDLSSFETIPWYLSSWFVLIVTSALLGWITLFRFVIGKQAAPVWTQKSIAVTVPAFLLLLVFVWIFAGSWESLWGVIVLMMLPLFPCLFVITAFLVLYPFDQALKNGILLRARMMREKMQNVTVVGITGSVGKTTTKELLSHILADRNVLSTPAHVNTELGVANFLLHNLNDEHQILIVEMGAYRRGEIAKLCHVVKPHIGIITYIGKQHLALFGSRDDLAKAKGELFASLPPAGHAFLNADSDYCADLSATASCPVHSVGTGGHATYEAYDIQEGAEGVSFTMRDAHFAVPLQGTHQITNIILAIATAEALGVPVVESAKRLQSFTSIPNTFERKEGEKGQVILDDTHNASPASFRAAIEWARTSQASHKILISSGLLELGDEVKVIYQELGLLSREVFHEVIFLNKRFIQNFEQGYGKRIIVVKPNKLRSKLKEGTLVVCEGRMPGGVVERLLK